jgi:hypothetical protein
MRLLAALPFAALVLSSGLADGATFTGHLVYSIATPNGNRQANSSLVQVELRKSGGKWSLFMQAAEYDASSYHMGKVNASCLVTSSDRDEIVTAYKLVMDNVNKPGVEVVCNGAVGAPAVNTVDLQQAGHTFSIATHA